MPRTFLLVLASAVLISCAHKPGVLTPGPTFEKDLQTALIEAKPGSTVELPEGRFNINGTLSLTVPNVTIRGQGIGKTVLSYKNQKTGAAGMLVTGNNFTLDGLTIEDTKGDGVKINNADGVTIRRVRVEWTGGPNEKNGSYGIYPVQCKNVLIEDSASIGAADAGIYVGQSKNIIVRRNRAEYNVAGIEIENSEGADVYENVATNNAGGLLVFGLPDLPVKGSRNTRVFNNQVFGNNTQNFAPKGNMVAKVPTGTGVLVLATHQADVYQERDSRQQYGERHDHQLPIDGQPYERRDVRSVCDWRLCARQPDRGGRRQPAGNGAERYWLRKSESRCRVSCGMEL